MNLLVTIGGIWIAFDGAYSIYEYRKQIIQEQQTIKEHLIRGIRIVVGAALAVFGLTI